MIFAFAGTHAQKRSSYSSIQLETAADYAKAEKSALEAANYILTLPVNKDNNSGQDAARFLVDWMQGTPDYMFPLNEPIGRISQNNNPQLLIVYMACMTRYVLENDKDKSPSEDDISYNGYLIFSDYCDNPKNNVSIKGELKNLIDARKEGNLKDYLEEFSQPAQGKKV
jgi:hypothetical protein